MRIRVEMFIDVPDKYFFEGDLKEASIHQTVWDHTIHELICSNLAKAIGSHKISDEKARDILIKNYETWADIFKNCEYTIREVEKLYP